jgi:hypothetical protein
MRLPGRRLLADRSLRGIAGLALDVFIKLFGDLLVFVYHCFDRTWSREQPSASPYLNIVDPNYRILAHQRCFQNIRHLYCWRK